MIKHSSTSFVGATLASALCMMPAGADSPAPPYAIPVAGAGVQSIVPILTVGEAFNNYEFVGIPDGLGAHRIRNPTGNPNTFRLYCNHELTQTSGVVRAHGNTGSFVSQWDFTFAPNGSTLSFTPIAATDAITAVQEYNDATGVYSAVPAGRFSRFCSGYLAGRWSGFTHNIFMTGEETAGTDTLDGIDGGQSWAIIDGTAYAVPRLGRSAKENQIVLRGTGAKTVVIPLEDTTPGQIYVYVGTKQKVGPNPLAPNGLHNGNLYVMVTDAAFDHEADLVKGQPVDFSLVQIDWTLPDNQLEIQSQLLGAMDFIRIEDGCYDLNDPDVFYFVTTGGGTANPLNPKGKLHKMVFDDVTNPTLGGTIEVLLDGSEGVFSPDNIDINADGHMMLNEDPNNNPTPNGVDSSIWMYNVNNAALSRVAQIDSTLAASLHGPSYLTGRWETTGIIDASGLLGPGWWLFAVQAHYSVGNTELVEGGQLLGMKWLPPAP